jgi:hypothetical protein
MGGPLPNATTWEDAAKSGGFYFSAKLPVTGTLRLLKTQAKQRPTNLAMNLQAYTEFFPFWKPELGCA